MCEADSLGRVRQDEILSTYHGAWERDELRLDQSRLDKLLRSEFHHVTLVTFGRQPSGRQPYYVGLGWSERAAKILKTTKETEKPQRRESDLG